MRSVSPSVSLSFSTYLFLTLSFCAKNKKNMSRNLPCNLITEKLRCPDDKGRLRISVKRRNKLTCQKCRFTYLSWVVSQKTFFVYTELTIRGDSVLSTIEYQVQQSTRSHALVPHACVPVSYSGTYKSQLRMFYYYSFA